MCTENACGLGVRMAGVLFVLMLVAMVVVVARGPVPVVFVVLVFLVIVIIVGTRCMLIVIVMALRVSLEHRRLVRLQREQAPQRVARALELRLR